MSITQRELDQTFSDLKDKYGKVKEDYFGLLYLKKEYKLENEDCANQVAFGGNDYGLDGFHIDIERRNLYLFQFKWSENHNLFKDSFKRLISAGFDRVFGNPTQDQQQNQLLLQLRSQLLENQSIINKVFVYFVFNGDPEAAEKSQSLSALREDLEAKKYLIDQFFENKSVSLTIDYISNQTRKKAASGHTRKTHTYKIDISELIKHQNENGDYLLVGFIRLNDLYRMYQEMGIRLFERNIRAGLSGDNSPNRAIRQALRNIVLSQQDSPQNFLFNHNGVTISAESIIPENGSLSITEPRILNGAQTITSFAKFLDENSSNQSLSDNLSLLNEIKVIAKIILPIGVNRNDFIVNVTINNNKQNPVEPWNLRASDQIQLEMADKFVEDLGVYYERLENAFESLSYEDLDDLGIEQYKSVELKKFAQTLLAAQGEIDKISRLREVFENTSIYNSVFKQKYLRTDARRLLAVYKIHYRLNRVINSIVESGSNKYWFAGKARNLIWALLIQALLNDTKLASHLDSFGKSITVEADFNELLKDYASRRVRFLLSDVIADKKYAKMMDEEKYSFFRTKAVFEMAMEKAYEKYKWTRLDP